jgi:ribonuclease HI
MEQTQMQVNVQASTSMERKMERIPEGNRCYVDASWDDYKTGIGIFFHFPATHNALFVKANSCMADSPLQAELLALQLALEIALLLNFTDTIFLTDCSMVADTTKKRSFQEDPGYWSLLPFWSQIQTLPDHLLRVYWIPRTLNKTADKLAKEARENFSSPVFSCQNISHIAYPLRSCFASVLNSNTRFRNYNINHVLCF